MKTLFHIVASLSVAALGSAACSKIASFTDEERVAVCCDISVVTRSSVQASEDAVGAWTIMAYCDGVLDRWTSGEGITEAATLLLKEGREYDFYALANVGEFTPPEREDGLREWTYCGAPVCGGMLPMRWSDCAVMVGPSMSVRVELGRFAAKVKFGLSDGVGGLRVSSVRLRQAPFRATPFASGGNRALPSDVADGDYASQDDLDVLNSGGTVQFYVLENVQGTLLPGNEDPWGKVPDALADPALSASCTYLEVCCDATLESDYTGTVKYRMYLGRDNTANFDIAGNSELNVNMYTTGEGLGRLSWRVESELENRFEYSYEILCPSYMDGVYASGPSGYSEPGRWLTVAEYSCLQIRRTDRSTGESCIIPLLSISSSGSCYGWRDFIDPRSGECIEYVLELCAPGRALYTVWTADGACVEVPLEVKAPRLMIGEDCTLMLDGTYSFMDISWTLYDGEEIDDPETFFDHNAFWETFTEDNCVAVSDRILYPSASNNSTDRSVLAACVGLVMSEFSVLVYVKQYSYEGHSLKEVLDRAVTGNSPGYVQFLLGIESDNLISVGAISVTVPWTNMPGRKWDVLDDYGIIGDARLKPGLSVSGNVSSGGITEAMFLYPVASSDVPVAVSLSKHPVSYYNNPAMLSEYEAGVSCSIPARRKYCTYSFNEGKRPAGELALAARLTNIHSHETMDADIGRMDCYVHIPVFASVDATVGESYFDTETREQGYWVSADVRMEAIFSCQDPIVDGFLSDLFTPDSDASRMLRGPSGNPPGVVQHYSYVRYYTDTYSGMPVDPYLYGDELYYINSIRWNTRLVSMLESVSSRPYVNIYDFGTTTAGGHWCGNYDERCSDSSGRGYYILEREKVSTRYASANEYRY